MRTVWPCPTDWAPTARAWELASWQDWLDVPERNVTSRLPAAAGGPSGATNAGGPTTSLGSVVRFGDPAGLDPVGVGVPAIIGTISLEPRTLCDDGAPGFG